jgi:hypothetical protein
VAAVQATLVAIHNEGETDLAAAVALWPAGHAPAPLTDAQDRAVSRREQAVAASATAAYWAGVEAARRAANVVAWPAQAEAAARAAGVRPEIVAIVADCARAAAERGDSHCPGVEQFQALAGHFAGCDQVEAHGIAKWLSEFFADHAAIVDEIATARAEFFAALNEAREHGADFMTWRMPAPKPEDTMAETIVNLTPHAVRVLDTAGNTLTTIPPSGQVARVSVTAVAVDPVAGLPVFRQQAGEIVDLPPPVPGVWYLVSLPLRLAAQAAGRTDVLSPGELIRDAGGQPVGCRGLAR